MKKKAILFTSTAFLLITAWFSSGYLYPDEHFQILEFAGLKLGLTDAGNLPWEYHHRMRPSLQPAIAVGVYTISGTWGIKDPFLIAFFLRLLSAVLTFITMGLIGLAYSGGTRDPVLRKWMFFLIFLTWYAVFTGVRFASEPWSGNFFLIGFTLLFLNKEPGGRIFLLSGVMMGFAMIFRFPVFLMVAGFVLWLAFVRKEKTDRIFLLILGTGISLVIEVFTDRWFYGEWTFTPWNYFEQNLLFDKISGFGKQPWWFYFSGVFQEAIPPFSLVIILAFLIYPVIRKRDAITWIVYPFLLFHFILGHKETRFLYPLIGLVPVVVIRSVEWIEERWIPGFSRNRFVRYFGITFIAVNGFLLVWIAFSPADNQAGLFKKLYRSYPSGATLFYLTENPYHRALDIKFYKRDNLAIRKAGTRNEINPEPGKSCLVVLKNGEELPDLPGTKKLIYRSFPDWLRIFNFNGWIERTNYWSVYEITAGSAPVSDP